MEETDLIVGQIVGTLSLICCTILSLAYIRNPSFRKPPGNLALWQFIFQAIYSLHWLTAYPPIFKILQGVPCFIIQIITVYGLLVSWNYLICTQLQICIAIKSMKPYNSKRNLFWHLNSHFGAIGFSIILWYFHISQNMTNSASPFKVCYQYSNFGCFWTSVLLMISSPILVGLLIYSWYLRGVRKLSNKLKQFQILTLAALLSVFPVCVSFILKTIFILPWPDYELFVINKQLIVLFLSAWGIFNFVGRVYSWSLLVKVLKAAFGKIKQRNLFLQGSLLDPERSRSDSLSLYPVLHQINTIVFIIQNIMNMLNTLSQLFKGQGLSVKMKKKNSTHRLWKFILENNSEASVIEVFWERFQNLRNIDKVTNQELIEAIQDRNNYVKIEESASNPGGSGFGFMFFTSNKRFILKTINSSEMIKLETIIGEYQKKVWEYGTFISRIYGAFQISIKNMNCSVVIFENIFYSVPQSVKFDLKGSEIKRQISTTVFSSPDQIPNWEIYKDIDFQQSIVTIKLKKNQRDIVWKMLEEDTYLFEKANIMDYSLLLGISKLEDQKLDQRTSKYRLDCKIQGQKYVVYMGIIDYFQSYNLLKKMERSYKGMNKSKAGLSVQPPGPYRERFIEKSKIWFS